MRDVRNMHDKLKSNLDVELPEDDAYYDMLHSKIMAKVESATIEPKPVLLKQRASVKKYWRTNVIPLARPLARASLTLAFSAVGMTLMYSAYLLMPKQANLTQTLISESLKNPSEFTDSFLNMEAEYDLVQDLSTRSKTKLNTKDLL